MMPKKRKLNLQKESLTSLMAYVRGIDQGETLLPPAIFMEERDDYLENAVNDSTVCKSIENNCWYR